VKSVHTALEPLAIPQLMTLPNPDGSNMSHLKVLPALVFTVYWVTSVPPGDSIFCWLVILKVPTSWAIAVDIFCSALLPATSPRI
jgi:hypothetical protein